MSHPLNIEADAELLELVSDALREGPDSPHWREALERMGPHGAGTDEYRQLCDARERLESGKGYRQVRAAPGFKNDLFQELDRVESGGRLRGVSPASWIAALSACVIVAVLALFLYLFSSPHADADPVQALSRVYFDQEQVSTRFDGAVPAGWRLVGTLPLEFSNVLRPSRSGTESADYRGGGIVSAVAVPADGPFQVDVAVRLTEIGDGTITQVFLTEQPQFSEDRATSPRELVWLAQGADPKVVLPDGRVLGSRVALKPSADPVQVRITLDERVAIVDCAGQRLWAGEHGLGDRPRHVGVRFLRRGGDADVAFESVRILKP